MRLAKAGLEPNLASGPDALLHELQVHQIELEMQNASLNRAQTLLAESYDRYVELYDFSPVAYLTLSPEGTISRINPTGAELLGQPCENLLKRRFKQFVLPEDHGRIDQLLTSVVQHGERQSLELELTRFDGSVFQAELVCRGMKQCGHLTVAHVAITDISARKQAEQQLRIAATAFESQEGMLVMNTRQVILRVNSAFTRITGYPAAEVIGGTLSLLDAGRHDEDFYSTIWELAARVGFWQGEVWGRRKSGEIFPQWLTISAVRSDEGTITHYVSTLTDHTLRKADEEKIKHLAFYDSLTQLPNRQLLLNRLHQALAASVRSGREGALLFIDLDNFKALNDSLGHGMGDLLLQQVAQRLNTCIREGDTVARLGGDEFVVMLEDLSPDRQEAADQIEAVGDKILATLNRTYDLGGHSYHNSPSIGATLFHDHKDNVTELLRSADLAMYHAKSAGRNTLRFFDPDMQAAVAARTCLEVELREALKKGQFALFYQAQLDSERRLIGAEALLRWEHPVRGLLSPAEFIAQAEDTGLILPIGLWVLDSVCRQLAAWSARAETAELSLSVNVSAREFRHPHFVHNVLSTLKRAGADPRKLCLEFSEGLLGRDLKDTVEKISALKSGGVRFSLDNFGCGYSSFACLEHLPLDQLKIGRPFVHNMLSDSADAAIVRTIIVLGRGLGLTVIADGVETEAQRDFLRNSGCDLYQGRFIGPPGPADALRI
ncbi:MAG: EAL domain-containing protein [Rhodocyclaceae bacterium]